MTDRRRARNAIAAEFDARNATAFVHAGSPHDPSLRYALPGDDARRAVDGTRYAVAVLDEPADGGGALSFSTDESDDPADRLAGALAERDLEGTVLVPRYLPHDAALRLEGRGFSLASSDVLDRARATKTDDERERIARAQRAAGAGVRRAAAALSGATVMESGALVVGGDPLAADRLRRTIDEGIVSAGGFPAGRTTVERPAEPGAPLRAGAPIVVSLAPRERAGYRGGLTRTVVVEGEGGPERRAHVATTRALESARALLTAGAETVGAVEADLAAEVRAFGFDDGIETAVRGVGLEATERPTRDDERVERGAIVRLEAAVRTAAGIVRVGDLLAVGDDGARWIDAPSRSLSPAAFGTRE